MTRDLAETAALVGDSGRAAMLVALLDGRALPAGELASIADVTPQTASSHLAKLVGGELLQVEQQGRHRYYRLASSEVAHAVEALLAITPRRIPSATALRTAYTAAGDLAFARSCYSHLAGNLAVQFADALLARRMVVNNGDKRFGLTNNGRLWFADFGIPVQELDLRDPRFARACLDWTERRHHIAGRLGSAILTRMRELRWIAPVRDSRAVRVTHEGQRRLNELLGLR
jgi:DNA-binding transcriptional ArsR family regulator